MKSHLKPGTLLKIGGQAYPNNLPQNVPSSFVERLGSSRQERGRSAATCVRILILPDSVSEFETMSELLFALRIYRWVNAKIRYINSIFSVSKDVYMELLAKYNEKCRQYEVMETEQKNLKIKIDDLEKNKKALEIMTFPKTTKPRTILKARKSIAFKGRV